MKPAVNHIISRRAAAPRLLTLMLALGPVAALFGQPGSLAPTLANGYQSKAAARNSAGAIRGKVLADGLPAADVHITVTAKGQITASTGFSDLMSRANQEVTEEDGSFSVEGLAQGAYEIEISAPGYIVDSGLRDEDARPIYYRPGDSASIRMIKGGVITGKVTDSQGQPLVKAPVHAIRLRDERGRPARASGRASAGMGAAETDDRGIYRLFGLESGVYIVSTGGGGPAPFSESTPFTGDSPAYHPFGTADTAVEVKVQAGQETNGVDISYSAIPGHSVSGQLSGKFATGGIASVAGVTLSHAKTGVPQAETMSMEASGSRPFVLNSVPDGEYFLTALSFSPGADLTLASPKRVVVKGSDVTGIDLVLAPIAAISGTVVMEASKPDAEKAGCKSTAATRLQEIIVSPHPAEKSKTGEVAGSGEFEELLSGYSTPDANGEFLAQVLSAGSYHLETDLHDEDLFLTSVTLPPEAPDKALKDSTAGTTANASPRDSSGGVTVNGDPKDGSAGPTAKTRPKDASSGIAVKTGQRVNGVTVTISHGAARLSGRVTAAAGSNLPDRLRAYLVPMDKEAADNTLRYYDALVRRDGSFEVKHIAPGRYFVVVHALTQDEWDEVNPRPIWWGTGPRRRLRQQAEAANATLELKPCQQARDYAVRYPVGAAPTAEPAKPPGAALPSQP